MSWLRTRHDIPLADATIDARKQVDRARFPGVKCLLTMGVDQDEMYEHFYRVMADVAADAGDRGMLSRANIE